MNKFFLSKAKRKSAISYIKICPGNGKIFVNKKEIDLLSFFGKKIVLFENLKKHLIMDKYTQDIVISVKGGGKITQIDSILLAISKILFDLKIFNRKQVNEMYQITFDTRIKERKKYGLKKARKRPQYSKR